MDHGRGHTNPMRERGDRLCIWCPPKRTSLACVRPVSTGRHSRDSIRNSCPKHSKIQLRAQAGGTLDSKETTSLWDPMGAWPGKSIWLWSGLAIVVSLVYVPLFVWELSGGNDSMTDFFQDWASARNFLEGLPVYSSHRVTIPRYLGKTDLKESDFFVEINAHPPTSILLLIPFGMLPYRARLSCGTFSPWVCSR